MHRLTPTYRRVLAELGLFYAAAVWGATFFVVKGVLDDVDAIWLVGYRFLLAGALLALIVTIRGRSLRRRWRPAIALGVLLWLLYVPQTLGLKYTTASNSGFITGLFVAFVPLFLATIFRRRPTTIEVVASAVSLAGLWVLTGGLSDINLGDILTLGAAMTYALHLLYVDRFMKAGADPWVIACQQFLVVGGLSVVTGLVLNLPFRVAGSGAVWTIIFLAAFPTLLAFVCQMTGQKAVSPLRVSLIFALEPVFAAAFAWTLGGEAFVTRRALGGLLIFLALVLSGLPWPRSRK